MKYTEVEVELQTTDPELEKLGLQTEKIHKGKILLNIEKIVYIRQEEDMLYILLANTGGEIQVFDGKDRLLSICKEL